MTMARVMAMDEIAANFEAVLQWITETGEDVLVERDGKLVAAIISYAKYEQWQALRRAEEPRAPTTDEETHGGESNAG
jgi:PHD/YefM family antitoxin component YafN of YafNO toxin-antitoxin module